VDLIVHCPCEKRALAGRQYAGCIILTQVTWTTAAETTSTVSHSEGSHNNFNPLNAELNPICHLLALLGAHLILHVSGIRVNLHGSMHCNNILIYKSQQDAQSYRVYLKKIGTFSEICTINLGHLGKKGDKFSKIGQAATCTCASA
jgi:hypothetical protein